MTCMVMFTHKPESRGQRNPAQGVYTSQPELSEQSDAFEYLLPNLGVICCRRYGQGSPFCFLMYIYSPFSPPPLSLCSAALIGRVDA